jgi:hypothetical protein
VYALLTLARHIQISQVIPDRRTITLALIELCERRLALPHCGVVCRGSGRL